MSTPCLAVPLLSLCALLAHAQEPPATAAGAAPVDLRDLLRDPRFECGVRVATRANYPPELREQARERWLGAYPATAQAVWEFIEIAETQNLSDNPDTPHVDGARLVYASRDESKRFEADTSTGEVRLVTDTEREWRGGCNLSGLQDGAAPRFCAGQEWNWPHFLLSQYLEDPARPGEPVTIDPSRRLVFNCTAELLSCAMGQPDPCPTGAWGEAEIGNHCLLYVDFVMVRRAPEGTDEGSRAARLIFALYPIFCSWDGATHSSPAPWLGLDPAGQGVYWTPNPTGLELNRPAPVTVDVGRLAREAVDALNQRYGTNADVSEYALSEMLLGWEIWGPFRCDVRLRDLSLRSEPAAAAPAD